VSPKALFLDRDGVINHNYGYVYRQEDFKFEDGIFELCRAAQAIGYLLIVATNQSGIARGYYTEADFAKITNWMLGRFHEEGVKITEVFYCPYHPEHGVGSYRQDSSDRKPNPGMLLKAKAKYGLSMAASVMLGDKPSDIAAAKAAGVGINCLYDPGFSDNTTIADYRIGKLIELIPHLKQKK
jgi:D-glycero-D-manno-heptose 1,7-bisphosphate phosphatase